MTVITMKYIFFRIPSKMLSFESSRLQLMELNIWAKTNALKTSVFTMDSFFSVSSNPRMCNPKKWKIRMTAV